MNEDKEETVYFSEMLPKGVADRMKQAISEDRLNDAIDELLLNKKREISADIEMLDDDILAFKSYCLKHKIAIRDIYTEQNDALYEMWQDVGDIHSKMSDQRKELARSMSDIRLQVNGLKGDLESFRKEMKSIDVYGAETLAGFARTVTNMSDDTKSILSVLLEKSRRE